MESIRLLCGASFIADGAGAPIIGLLYGKRTGAELHIEAWVPAGELRSHNDAEFALKLQMRLAAQRPETAGLECLGWMRTRNHGEPRMVEEDRSMFDRCFPASWQLTMLVRPSFQKPTKVALFQRRADGEIRFDRPAQEFFLYPPQENPLDSPQETRRTPSAIESHGLGTMPVPEEGAAAPASVASSPAPIAAPPAPASGALPFSTELDPLRAAQLAAEFGPDAELLPRGTVRAFSPWIAAMLMIVGLMAGSGVAALRAPIEPLATSTSTSPLRVVREGNNWQVHWEKSLAELPGVSGARLSITRDGYTKNLALPLMDLRSGATRLDWVSDEMDLQLRLDRPGYPEIEQRVRVVGMSSKPKTNPAR